MLKSLSVLSLSVGATAGKWTNLCPVGSSSCPPIMLGLSCKDGDASLCAVVGGYTNTPFGVYYSEDEFATFTRANLTAQPVLILDIAIDDQGTAATADVGVFGTGLLYSSDVKTWFASAYLRFTTGQCVRALGEGHFSYVGSTGNGNQGVLHSSDGAIHWKAGNWPAALSNMTDARYGAFPSDDAWYITGGNFPSNNNDVLGNCYRMTESTCVDGKPRLDAHRSASADSYYGVITKSTDKGQTWKTQFETTDFYFNQMDCFDADTCVAVGEAHAGAGAGGYIYMTTNGGDTWTKSFVDTNPGAGMMPVKMISKTEIFAAGGNNRGSTAYHSTDGGATWAMDGEQLRLVGEVMSFDFIDNTKAFAVGVTNLQTSVVMKYEA